MRTVSTYHLNDEDRHINATTISKTNTVMVQLQRTATDILHIIDTDNSDITNLPRTVGEERDIIAMLFMI